MQEIYSIERNNEIHNLSDTKNKYIQCANIQ